MRDASLPSLRGEGDGGDICPEGENQRRWMKLTKGRRMRSKRGQRAAPWRRRKTGEDEGRMGSVLSFAGG